MNDRARGDRRGGGRGRGELDRNELAGAPDGDLHIPRRVLILRHGYFAHDPRVKREAAALVAAGHAVDVVCLRAPGEASSEVLDGVAVTRLPVAHRRAGMLRYVWEYAAFFIGAAGVAAWRQLRRRYDVVQVNTLPDALVFAAWVPKRLGARVVLDLHEVMPELAMSKFGLAARHPLVRLVGWSEQAAIRFADACVAVSGPCLDCYVARGADPAKFTVVMNSPDPALFGPAPAAAEDGGAGGAGTMTPGPGGPAAGTFGRFTALSSGPSTEGPPTALSSGPPNALSSGPPNAFSSRPSNALSAGPPNALSSGPPNALSAAPCLVGHGTLLERHGYDVLLRALGRLPGVRAEILGDGEARPALEALARELGIAARVTFAGRVPLEDVRRRLMGATLGVVANRRDPFMDLVVPTKLLEYMALGIPAVVARTPAVAAHFGPDEVSFFEAGDPEDLARVVRGLLGDGEARARQARLAAATVEARYGWLAMAARYVAVVEGCA